jgi:PAS domain S-box-containing protein
VTTGTSRLDAIQASEIGTYTGARQGGLPATTKTRARHAIELTIVCVAYYAAARIGLVLQLPGTNVSAVWPPSGIGLAAVLVCGLDVWPAIAVGAFLANLLTLPTTWAAFGAAGGIAAGNTLEHVAAFLLIRRLGPSLDPFSQTRHAFWFVACAVISCLIAATTGATTLLLSGIINVDRYRSVWLTWWVGDGAGMVILAPALYAWMKKPRLSLPAREWSELLGVLTVTVVLGEVIFGGWSWGGSVSPRPYLLMPVLLWTAFRFGLRETSSLAVLISVLAVTHTWSVMGTLEPSASRDSLGAFVDLSTTPNEWLMSLQIFVCTTAMIAVILAAAVAERKDSEAALHSSERRFRTIFEQAGVGAALIDTATGRFYRVNQKYCEIVGYSVQEMTETSFQALTHPIDLPRDLAYMARLKAGEIGEFSMEKRYYRKDGSIVWVNLTVSPTWKAGERPESHIAIVEDITERKHAEATLRDTNVTLEERVQERTSQLEGANRELEEQIGERRRVENRLRNSLQEKETLLREIHHRVKNNLAVISSLFYLETTYTKDGRTVRLLQEARNRVISMAMVHEELYRSGNLAAVNFRKYVEDLLNYLLDSYSTSSSPVRLTSDVEELLLGVDTAIPCGLILTELVTNSLKHAFQRRQPGTISVSLRKTAPDGEYVLTVADDGAGIASDLGAANGASLGLRIVRALTDQLRGNFSIRSSDPGTEAKVQFAVEPTSAC